MSKHSIAESLKHVPNAAIVEQLLLRAFPKMNAKSICAFIRTLELYGIKDYNLVSFKKISVHLQNIAQSKLMEKSYEVYSMLSMTVIKINVLCNIITTEEEFEALEEINYNV